MNLRDLQRRMDQSGRIGSGPDTMVFESVFGKIVRPKPRPVGFTHNWLATLVGEDSAAFEPGFVNNVPAAIKGVPLAGTKDKEPPVLKFGEPRLNADGLGWFCVEVTCLDAAAALAAAKVPGTAAPEAWSVLKAEMVQVADPDTDDGLPGKVLYSSGGARPLSGNRARWPVSMIQRRQDGTLDLFQIEFFPFTHRVSLRADGVSAARHFFF